MWHMVLYPSCTGSFRGKIARGSLGDEQTRVESSIEEERDEKSGKNLVVTELIELIK